jgi:hypothetical protein
LYSHFLYLVFLYRNGAPNVLRFLDQKQLKFLLSTYNYKHPYSQKWGKGTRGGT